MDNKNASCDNNDKGQAASKHPAGIVKEVNEDKVIVVFNRSSACGKCDACGMLKETGEMYLSFEKTQDVQVGETVDVYVDEGFFLLSALLLYGIPLAVLLAGIGISSLIFKEGYYQIISAFIGVGLCIVSYYVLKRFNGYFDKIKKKYMKYTKIK